jgi:hypothetical protein
VPAYQYTVLARGRFERSKLAILLTIIGSQVRDREVTSVPRRRCMPSLSSRRILFQSLLMLVVSSAGACYHFRNVHELLNITDNGLPTHVSTIYPFTSSNSQKGQDVHTPTLTLHSVQQQPWHRRSREYKHECTCMYMYFLNGESAHTESCTLLLSSFYV